MKHIKDTCDLIDEQGKVIDSDMDRRIDFHFNAMLDIVAEWRKDKSSDRDDDLLGEIVVLRPWFPIFFLPFPPLEAPPPAHSPRGQRVPVGPMWSYDGGSQPSSCHSPFGGPATSPSPPWSVGTCR